MENRKIGFRSQQIRKVRNKSYNDPPAHFGEIFVQPIVCERTVCIPIYRPYLLFTATTLIYNKKTLADAWVVGSLTKTIPLYLE